MKTMRQILNELRQIEMLNTDKAKKHAQDIERWSKEIEWEEAHFGSRLQADLRNLMSMSDDELDAYGQELDWKLRKYRKREEEEQAQRQRHQYELKAQADAENQAMLDGIKQGAAKHSEKRVKQMADKQIQRVLKK